MHNLPSNLWYFITIIGITAILIIIIIIVINLKYCPSLLDTTGIWLPSRNVRNSPLFTATCKNSPTARCVTAANRVCKDSDIFRTSIISLKQILCCTGTFLHKLICVSSEFRVFPQCFYISFLVIWYCFLLLVYLLVCVVFVLCTCPVFAFYLCFCAGFIIVTFAVKPAR
jgi:hypothetical protein